MLFYFLLFIGFFLIFFIFHLISYYFFDFLYFNNFNLLTYEEKRSSQHEFTSSIAVIGIFICYLIGALDLYSGIEKRWTETNHASYLGIILTLGYTVYEEILYLIYKKELIYHIHHLLACIITIYSCIYPKLHFFICWGGTVEITGIFVNLFLLSRRFKISATITNIYGFLMWLSFVIFRFISLIFMFLVIFFDIYYNSKYSLHLVALPYLIVCGVSAIILFSLSIYWLSKITNGLIKVLCPKKKMNQIHPIQVDCETNINEGNQVQKENVKEKQIDEEGFDTGNADTHGHSNGYLASRKEVDESDNENNNNNNNDNNNGNGNNNNNNSNSNKEIEQLQIEIHDKKDDRSKRDTHLHSGDIELGTESCKD